MCPRFLFVDTNKSVHKGHHPQSHTWSTHGRIRTLTAMGCDGVFSNLIDQASFIDKVVLSVRGKKRKRPQAAIETVQNLAIGGPGRFYGRALHFNCRDGGNPGELRYAPLTHFPSVPPLRLI